MSTYSYYILKQYHFVHKHFTFILLYHVSCSIKMFICMNNIKVIEIMSTLEVWLNANISIVTTHQKFTRKAKSLGLHFTPRRLVSVCSTDFFFTTDQTVFVPWLTWNSHCKYFLLLFMCIYTSSSTTPSLLFLGSGWLVYMDFRF